MRKDKKEVIQLREDGLSYRQIEDKMNIPRSTLSEWLRPLGWSNNIRKALEVKNKGESIVRLAELNRIRGRKLENIYKRALEEADYEYEAFKHHPLFIATLMLYWGEGDKSSKAGLVKIGNTDPDMLKVFVIFLKDLCGVLENKIRVHLILYPELDADKCVSFWAERLGIPISNFQKSTIIQGRHKTRRLEWGVCFVMVPSTYLKLKVCHWVERLGRDVINKSYYAAIV